MYLVNDEKTDDLRESDVAGGFTRDDVPLFRRGHDHLRLHDFLLGHLHVSRQLPNHHA